MATLALQATGRGCQRNLHGDCTPCAEAMQHTSYVIGIGTLRYHAGQCNKLMLSYQAPVPASPLSSSIRQHVAQLALVGLLY